MIRTILVPLDGSPQAECALSHALAVARAFGSEIVLLRVQEDARKPGDPIDTVSWRLGGAEARCYVDRLAATLGGQGARARGVLAEGDPAEKILREAREQAADLVVLSRHGQNGPSEFTLGGNAEKVLARAGISVLVTDGADPLGPAPAMASYRRLAVPLDGSQRARWALLQAIPLARAHDGEILLVHIVTPSPFAAGTPPTPEEEDLARRFAAHDRQAAESYLRDMAALVADSGVAVRTLLLDSANVVQALQKVALDEQVPLVVISAHGRSGAAPWPYGSVADRLIHHGAANLLVLQDMATASDDEDGGPAPVGAAALRGAA